MVQEGEVALTEHFIDSFPIMPEDTVNVETPVQYGLVLTSPEPFPSSPLRNDNQTGVSVILSVLFILLLVIALRFHNNTKYVGAVFRNIIDTRIRHNVFDDTVRETSFIILLNILWCVCMGITGYCCLRYYGDTGEAPMVGGILGGIALSMVYCVVMGVAYYGVGWVFSDKIHARNWYKGFIACQALMAPFFLVTALLSICWSGAESLIFFFTAAVYILVKLIFIWKGYKIFFSQISSWVLFLCYLCSLEIVPVILTYRLAVDLWNWI